LSITLTGFVDGINREISKIRTLSGLIPVEAEQDSDLPNSETNFWAVSSSPLLGEGGEIPSILKILSTSSPPVVGGDRGGL
jgi:hypothetical protein